MCVQTEKEGISTACRLLEWFENTWALPWSSSTNDDELLSSYNAGIFPLPLVLWFMYEYKRLQYSVDYLTNFSSHNFLDKRKFEAQVFQASRTWDFISSEKPNLHLSHILDTLQWLFSISLMIHGGELLGPFDVVQGMYVAVAFM